jgi:hypothetical protein
MDSLILLVVIKNDRRMKNRKKKIMHHMVSFIRLLYYYLCYRACVCMERKRRTVYRTSELKSKPIRRVPGDVGIDRAPNKATLSHLTAACTDTMGRKYYNVSDKPQWVSDILKMHPKCTFYWVSLPVDVSAKEMPMMGDKVTMTDTTKRSVREASVGIHMKDRKTGWVVLTST